MTRVTGLEERLGRASGTPRERPAARTRTPEDRPSSVPDAGRTARGRTAYHAGRAAERAVARAYAACGYVLEAERWRGGGAEIDLILRRGGLRVFVEVKAAPTHAAAAGRVGPRQAAGLIAAAEAYLAAHAPGAPARLDVATMDGSGRVRVLPNALGQ